MNYSTPRFAIVLSALLAIVTMSSQTVHADLLPPDTSDSTPPSTTPIPPAPSPPLPGKKSGCAAPSPAGGLLPFAVVGAALAFGLAASRRNEDDAQRAKLGGVAQASIEANARGQPPANPGPPPEVSGDYDVARAIPNRRLVAPCQTGHARRI
jgi:hypothetical protein